MTGFDSCVNCERYRVLIYSVLLNPPPTTTTTTTGLFGRAERTRDQDKAEEAVQGRGRDKATVLNTRLCSSLLIYVAF